jgi:DNA-binding IclR family transcriptional regulator
MIQVVERVGKILTAFTHERPELTLTECAERSGLTKSSTHRILLSLQEIGLVERDGAAWRLGTRVVSLSAIRLGSFDLRREAVARLLELRDMFRAATAFSIPHGSDMIYVERQESPEPFAATARLGAVAPIWAGASGRAILAHLDAGERSAVLDVPAWHHLPPSTRMEVLGSVDQAAGQGYAVDPGGFFEGTAAVAVAIRDANGRPVAALSVIMPPERLRSIQLDAMGTQLLEAAADLETQTGFRTDPLDEPPRGSGHAPRQVASEVEVNRV